MIATKQRRRARRVEAAPLVGEPPHLSAVVRTSLIQAIGADPLPDIRVTTVEIIDTVSNTTPGALVLGVGLDEEAAVHVLDRLGRDQAAALVVRTDVATERVEQAARRAGVSLVHVRDEVSWTTSFRTMHSLISGGASNEFEEMIYEADDLSELARALAARLENPLTIENTRGEILAYSAHDTGIDPARQETILARKSPPDLIEKLRRAGVFRRINASDEPVRLDDSLGVRSRIAMAIREGDRPLGYIWVIEVGPRLGPEKLALLRQVARLAASYMIRLRLERDLAQRIRDDFIRDIVRSEVASHARMAARAASVGLSINTPFEVLAAHADPVGDCSPEMSETEAQAVTRRLLELAAFEAAAVDPDALCASIADRVLVLLPAKNPGALRGTGLAEKILAASRMTLPKHAVSIGVGTIARDLTELPIAHKRADQALRVADLVYGGHTVLAYDTLGVYKALAESESLADGGVLSGAVETLVQHDALRSTCYGQTLEIFLDEFGDRAKTARLLKVHHNTLAYRLKRIQEIAHIDLNDPEARLAAQLQFRAMRLCPQRSSSR